MGKHVIFGVFCASFRVLHLCTTCMFVCAIIHMELHATGYWLAFKSIVQCLSMCVVFSRQHKVSLTLHFRHFCCSTNLRASTCPLSCVRACTLACVLTKFCGSFHMQKCLLLFFDFLCTSLHLTLALS